MVLSSAAYNRATSLITHLLIKQNVFRNYWSQENFGVFSKLSTGRKFFIDVTSFKDKNRIYFCRKSHFNRVTTHNIHKNLYVKFHNMICFRNISKRSFSVSLLFCKDKSTFDQEVDLVLRDKSFEEINNRLCRHPGTSHNVVIVQPKLTSGPNREKPENSQCKLEEALSLVNTLPNWKVKRKLIIPTVNSKSKFIFGSGNLEKLKQLILQDLSVTAVFIGLNIMTALQVSTLENILKVPVFDRYQIILQIFHDHAHTVEARLQLALAEIPYLRVKLAGFSVTKDSSTFSGIHHVGGDGETFIQRRRQILNDREYKLKKALEKVKKQRELLRKSERRTVYPLIAVVGYTNSGKTTLIKSLTNDSRLTPEDKLFATLDVTLHLGSLPSKHKVLYIDTVGFIADVPTSLIQSFKSTLEEIILADLVVHIRDISHPDTEKQKETVLKTLQELGLPEKLTNSILEVRNKADLLENIPETECSNAFYISAVTGHGLSEVLDAIEQQVFENTGHKVVLIRIPNGGAEYSWLMREGGLRDSVVDVKNSNYLIVEVVLAPSKVAQFQHEFGDLFVAAEDIVV